MRAILATLAVAAAICPSAAASGRAVTLSDANLPPTTIHTLRAHSALDMGAYPCAHRGVFSETSAYAADGGAIGSQWWSPLHLRYQWRYAGHHVTFDGRMFRNHAAYPVLVAGWCEA